MMKLIYSTSGGEFDYTHTYMYTCNNTISTVTDDNRLTHTYTLIIISSDHINQFMENFLFFIAKASLYKHWCKLNSLITTITATHH